MTATQQARQATELEANNNTFEALAREWHTLRIASWDAVTAKRVRGALERHVSMMAALANELDTVDEHIVFDSITRNRAPSR
ncbi:hypothetical protein AO287_23490 [Pseudomonas savastanoi]|uniref:Uncharacterized protein n=1 Tax=Pseudomonas savastanoi TaxID=29438 RepID=A0AAW3M5R8_PSESS|nr:hypothetical protein AO287_23490 [Pseudomonas savastanoi]